MVTRVRCPYCHSWIPQPFARGRVAVANTHVRVADPHGPRCRVIVVTATQGEQHEVHRVPEGVTLETVMERISESIARAA